MTADEKIQAVLIANSALGAAVPASRIKTVGDWQGLDVPYIIHQPVSPSQPTRTHTGLEPLRMWDFYEVSIYARTHSEARQIADLVVAALDGYRDADVDPIALAHGASVGVFDTDRKVARVTLDFEVAGALT